MFLRRSCIYAPYIQKLINSCFEEDFDARYTFKRHTTLQISLEHNVVDPTNPRARASDDEEGSSSHISQDAIWRKTMYTLCCMNKAQLDSNRKTRASSEELIKLMKEERRACGLTDDLSKPGSEEEASPWKEDLEKVTIVF